MKTTSPMHTHFAWLTVLLALGLLALTSAAAPTLAAAQNDGFGDAEPADSLAAVEIEARFEPATATAGDVVDLVVAIQVRDGYHTYPTLGGTMASAYAPIELTTVAADGLSPSGDWLNPAIHVHGDEYVTNPHLSGMVEFRQKVRIGLDASGSHTATVEVRGLSVCDDVSGMCLLASDTDLTAAIEVSELDKDGVPNEGAIGWTASFYPPAVTPDALVRLDVTANTPFSLFTYSLNPELHSSDPPKFMMEVPAWLEPVSDWQDATYDDKGHVNNGGTYSRYFRVAKDAADVEHTSDIEIQYMACTEETCYLPPNQTVAAHLTVAPITPFEVLANVDVPESGSTDSNDGSDNTDNGSTDSGTTGGDGASETGDDSTPSVSPGDDSTPSTPVGGGEEETPEQGSIDFIFYIIGLAFLSLLTPCVFPMIPITISHFTNLASATNEAGESTRSQAKMVAIALTYAFAIVLTFTTVALVLTLILGASFDPQELGSNEWLNLFLGLLVIAFALSFFGLFEITVPRFITNRFQAGGEDSGAFITTFIMGVGFTLGSFACTAPILGIVIALATQQNDLAMAVVYTLIYSVAFALPFVLLGISPGLLKSLPRSGAWMVRIKGIFAFVLILAAPYFLLKADMAFGWGIFSRSFILSIWAATFIGLALYLLGVIRLKLEAPKDTTGPVSIFVTLLLFGMAIYTVIGAATGRMMFSVGFEAFLSIPEPEAAIVSGNTGGGGASSNAVTEGNERYDIFSEAIAAAREQNEPLFVDFTGYFCANCKANERTLFDLPSVVERFNQLTFVKQYTDANRKADAPEHQKQEEDGAKIRLGEFGGRGTPYYVVIDPNTREVLSTAANLQDEASFTAFLDRGLEAWEARK